MTDIKIGDWVYYFCSYTGNEMVFKCKSVKFGQVWDSKYSWIPEYCHRLTPLEPGEAKVGDRCVVLNNDCLADGDIGDIVNITFVFSDTGVDIQTKNGHKQLICNHDLARLPDCAQRAPGAPDECPNHNDLHVWQGGESLTVIPVEDCELDSIPKAPKDKQIRMEVLGRKKPTPCPHPEWEGVWLYCGEAHRIEWDGTGFMAHEINTPDMDVFCLCPDTEWYSDGPTPRWTQLEPAPTASTAGPKLPRPQKHGAPTVPWDPYGEG